MHRASIASVLLVAAVAAQESAPSRPQPAAQAARLVKLLELDEQRGKAGMELWRIGKDAVPALVHALGDPRDEIVEAAAAVLAEIGTDAAAAAPDLERLLASAKGRRLRALRWAQHGIAATGIALVEWGANQVTLLDDQGNATGKIPAQKGIWDVQPLPEGRYLVAEVTSRKVRELDDKGNELWHLDAPGMRVQRLLNGNTLVASYEGQGVREFDDRGEVVWEYAVRTCTWAHRLLDGHTLLIDQPAETLFEVDAKGNEVRSFKIGTTAFDAQRLSNGHTLVAARSMKAVREFDASGKEVATIGDLVEPNTCLRLCNGTTLLGGQNELLALDPGGKVLWRYKCQFAGAVRR